MIIKAEVTAEEKALIEGFAKAEGKSMSAYLKSRAMQKIDPSERFMECINIQSEIANRINEIATTIIRNKVIYEAEVLELLERMTALEMSNATMLKEVRKNGNPRKQKHKVNAPGGG